MAADFADSGTQTFSPEDLPPEDECQDIATTLAKDVISYFVGITDETPRNQYEHKMRAVVADILTRYSTTFDGMITRLNVVDESSIQTVVKIINEIFTDGRINWGRIATVYAFGCRVGQVLYARQLPVVDLYQAIGQYVRDHLCGWIRDRGGWDDFVLFFHANQSVDIEEKLWNGLLWTAAALSLAGAAALASSLFVR